MRLIDKNLGLYALLKSEIYIISAKITSIHIYSANEELVIDVTIDLLYDKGRTILIRFTDITEYVFNHANNYSFYYIEDYKLLLEGSLFYISFDPDQSTTGYAESDNDFILCGSIEGFYI